MLFYQLVSKFYRSTAQAVRKALPQTFLLLTVPIFGMLSYGDGKELEEYSGDRSYETIAQYIDKQSKQYIRSLDTNAARSDGAEQAVMAASDASINAEGTAEEVDEATLEHYKSLGPVFVKFYAPW